MNFSIALATYNGARFIQQQLDSFLAQTLRPSELVVCDDRSTDDTLEIVQRFARTAPFAVRMERNERRLGVSNNFFKAASLCTQEWIAYSDQDDVWLPEKLATIRRIVLGRPGLLLATHQAVLVDENLQPLGGLLQVPAVSRLTFIPARSHRLWLPPLGFTIAFDARLIREYPFECRPIVTHDRWIYVLATSLGEVAYLPEALALYRRHGGNFSTMLPPVSLSRQLRNPDSSSEFAHQAETMRCVADFFDRCPRASTIAPANALVAARDLYRRQARMLGARAELFSADQRFGRRLSRYIRMVARGAYLAHGRGGLGWRAAVKDAARVILSVALPPEGEA